MEFGDQLKELNVTADEIDRLSKAFKDETFRELLCDYAKEISDPETRRRYEKEIKIMEQERGNGIEFIHPEPFRALGTSVNGEQTCFVNICGNEKVGKPSCEQQYWSLPHNLHPGRRERDPDGSEITIYDVIFHPDTLHMASKSEAFMDMVESVAFDGIQNAFGVSLDRNNAREAKTKYQGTPQPCIVRKPNPGYKSEERDPLAFPYPRSKSPSSHGDAETRGPTVPSYAVKYRSFIDLLDYRCSRDSAPSPRPREIVVTVDLPLLKAARDASLEVEERRLLLEAEEPAYRLELPLAYPVDGDRGEASFNRQRGQLTITLPVLPSDEARDFAAGLAEACTGGDEEEEEEEEKREAEEDAWKGKEQRGDDEGEEVKDGGDVEEEQTGVEKGEDEGGSGCVEKEDIGLEEAAAKWERTQGGPESGGEREQRQGDEREDEILREHRGSPDPGRSGAAEDTGSSVTGCERESVHRRTDAPAEETSCDEIAAEPSRLSEKRGEDINLIPLESKPTPKTSHFREETGDALEDVKLGKGAAFPHNAPADTHRPETAGAKESGGGGSEDGVPRCCSEELATGSGSLEEGGDADEDEDDPPTLQLFQSPGCTNEPLPALREIDEHGKEKVISDHSTSAGFVFQNSLMYELD